MSNGQQLMTNSFINQYKSSIFWLIDCRSYGYCVIRIPLNCNCINWVIQIYPKLETFGLYACFRMAENVNIKFILHPNLASYKVGKKSSWAAYIAKVGNLCKFFPVKFDVLVNKSKEISLVCSLVGELYSFVCELSKLCLWVFLFTSNQFLKYKVMVLQTKIHQLIHQS